MSAPVDAIKVRWEALRTIAYGDVGSSYTAIGTPLEYSSREITITNTTDQLLYFSTDGVDDMFICPSGAARIWDHAANKSNQGGFLAVSANTQFYVLYPGTGPSSGSVYLETVYGSDV